MIELDAIDQHDDVVVITLLFWSIGMYLAEWFFVLGQFKGESAYLSIGVMGEESFCCESFVV